MTAEIALFAAVFLACLVEAVEATTIVVAMGATRSWRSALLGAAVATLALAAAVAVFGPAILLLPIGVLRVVVGGLLLVFGLSWLRKAVLRASGVKALRDEEAAYRKQVAAASAAGTERRFGVSDWFAFTVSFKGAFLEGLEVVFIVLTFATNQGNLPVAITAALAAIVVVVIAGAVVRGPLSRVPENTLKFVVGIMLTSFGVFWGAEGAGAEWPGGDAAILVIAPAVAVLCLVLVVLFRRRRTATAAQPATAVRRPGPLARFGLFWYDFIVGDDWRVTLGVALALGLTALGAVAGWGGAWVIAAVAVVVLVPFGTLRAARAG